MELTPIAFGMFKAVVLVIGMYFAIKWHYDQGEKEGRRAVLRTGGLMAAAFLTLLLIVGTIAFALSSMLGLDLRLP